MVEVDPFKLGETAGTLASGAQSERHAEKAALRDAAAGTPEMQLAAQAHAKRLAVKEQFLLGLWRPLAKWAGVSQEYFATDFPKELAAKLEDVPEEDLQTPKAAIVAPAMEALAYSLDEPKLKEMYLNLLAGASLTTKASQVHPSFVEAIRQLSSEEVPVLDGLLRLSTCPLVRVIRVRQPDGGVHILAPYLVPWSDTQGAPQALPGLAAWIENWERLGLISTTFLEYALSEDADPTVDPYAWASERPEFIALRDEDPRPPEVKGWDVEFQKGLIRRTTRGEAFYKVVNSPN